MPRAPQAEDSGPGPCAQHAEQGILCVSEHMCVHTGDRLLLQENTCGQESGGGDACYHACRASLREHNRAQKCGSFLPKYTSPHPTPKLL